MASVPLKDQIRQRLHDGRLEEVAELALARKRTLGILVSLTFDDDLQVVWRAIEAMGMAANGLSRTHPGYVKEHVRRLYWLITEESGGVFWRAPECMAECAVQMPHLLESHVPIAFHLLETLEDEDLEHFRPGALWAIGRLAALVPEDLPGVLPLVVEALDRPDAQARGMAVWCLGEVGEAQLLEGREELLEDPGTVSVYRDRVVTEKTVGHLVRECLDEVAHPS